MRPWSQGTCGSTENTRGGVGAGEWDLAARRQAGQGGRGRAPQRAPASGKGGASGKGRGLREGPRRREGRGLMEGAGPQGREGAGSSGTDAGTQLSASSRDIAASLPGTVPYPQGTALQSSSDFRIPTLQLLP